MQILTEVFLQASPLSLHSARIIMLGINAMPPKDLRCEVHVIPEGDRTGEHAIECRAVALPCTECGESAGCEEHTIHCPRCGKPVCDYCADEHRCVAKGTEKAKRDKAA